MMDALGAPVFPRDFPVRARCLAALTKALGEERLAAAREAGRDLTLEAAIAEAQAVAQAVMASPQDVSTGSERRGGVAVPPL
jgi:hypothetical protein